MPTNYKILFTPLAKEDLGNIYNYISNTLFARESAIKIINGIEKRIQRLKTMPYSAPLFDEPQFTIFNLRKLTIKQYALYYIVNETTKQIEIIRILHTLMNRDKALDQAFDD
jgi:addiction module RelE/StbE family toxin